MSRALDPTLSSLTDLELVTVAGGFDLARMVDRGNSWAGIGATAGAGVGLVAGAAGGPPGMATGAGIGMAVGGAGGWLAGAATDAWSQLRGR